MGFATVGEGAVNGATAEAATGDYVLSFIVQTTPLFYTCFLYGPHSLRFDLGGGGKGQ